MRVLKQMVIVVGAAFLGNVAIQAVEGNWLLTLVVGLAGAAFALLAYAWAIRTTERRSPVEVGLAGAGAALSRGLLIGVLMFGAVIASIAVGGGYRIEDTGSVTAAVALIGLVAAGAVVEELIFRGLLFRLVEKRTGTWIALAVSSVVFGAMHLANPDATLWGVIAIAIEAGAMLGAAYAATRTLWLPIGLHIAWNFAAAGIFGTVVSGSDMPQGLLRGVTSGPAVLTGGEFGPEGSIYAVLAGSLLTAVFLVLARRRGNIVPSRRRAAQIASAATL
ncbi:CPBP family intramembrane glutamic endopeptidase [Cellulomonas timonensis]|uniref:CPBP family intramembrane glutamic endopeptidase n=1 Tax=Cellulomonas timonensis TaxID=1689271 RepID=UPI0008365180|nr:CPBP family intramembrane glutamic endopeptidase [Cellulomonas timonensis]